MAVDLHVHSNISDGAYSPQELVAMARERGVSALALTDHDRVDGVPSALSVGRELGVLVIPGVELSTDIQESEVHVLGFYIDIASAKLHEILQELKKGRVARCEKILCRLKALGINIPLSYVLSLGKDGFAGRSQIFRAMVDLGFARAERHYGDFQRYLGKTGFAYVEHQGLSPEEAVGFIKACRGVPVLAHPGTQIPVRVVENLIKAGLEGIEAYHPSHDERTSTEWQMFAKHHDLIVTGGSDFHRIGPGESASLGSMDIPDSVVPNLVERWRLTISGNSLPSF